MYWKRVLWILWTANFLISAGISMVVPFLPLYIEKLGVHNVQSVAHWSGWIFSAQFLTSFLFQPLWGRLADKYGKKSMLLRSAIGMGVVTILMAFVTSPAQLLILRLINGVFSGFISMSIALQASVTPDENSGKVLGTLQTGQIVGTLVGPLLGGALSELVGYNGVFIWTGALILLGGVVVMGYIRETPRQPISIEEAEQPEQPEQPKHSWRSLKMLIPVFVASTITQLSMMSIQPILPIYTKTIYSGEHLALMVGLVSAITGIANLVGSPTLGRLGDKFGQRKILVFSLVMSALAFIPQAFATNITVLLIGRFLLGLFIGGMLPSLNVLVKKMTPKDLQGTAFGFNSSARFLGNLIGPILGSFVATALNMKDVFYFTIAFLLINAVMIVFAHSLDIAARKVMPK